MNRNRQSAPYQTRGLRSLTVDSRPFVSILCFCTPILLVPSLAVRSIIILILGVLIFSYEMALKLPVPMTPGTLLWLGSTLSYIVGGIVSKFLFEQTNDFGLVYLDSALLYLGLGLASYAFGMLLVGKPSQRDAKKITGLHFTPARIIVVVLLFILPVVGRTLVDDSSAIYSNLIIGALQSIEIFPTILFSVYLLQPRRVWWLGLLLLAASLALPWEDMLVGYGRMKLPFAIITLIFTYMSLVWYSGKRISLQAKLLLMLSPIFIFVFFTITSSYRQQIEFDRGTTEEYRSEIISQSVRELTRIDSILTIIEPLITRLIEKPSLELLGWIENDRIEQVGWTHEDTKQVILTWIPKAFFPDKGVGYGRDIMEFYGLSSASNNIPVTILTDAYRRGGVFGVMSMYFLMGVASTTIASKLQGSWGTLGLILAIFFASLHFLIYSEDVLEVIKLYIYRLPSSGLVIYAFLRATRIRGFED